MIEIDNAPWFVAADVSAAIGISKQAQADALSKYDTAGLRLLRVGGGAVGRPNKLITEQGVYDLALQSRKPRRNTCPTFLKA